VRVFVRETEGIVMTDTRRVKRGIIIIIIIITIIIIRAELKRCIVIERR